MILAILTPNLKTITITAPTKERHYFLQTEVIIGTGIIGVAVDQTSDQQLADDSSGADGSQLAVDVSASAPNVRLVEVDITPMLAPTHLSVNCDSQESVVEMADEVSVPTVSASQLEPKISRNRRQDVIV